MVSVTLTAAKANLSDMVERASQGETVIITRRGKTLAQMTRLREPRQPIDIEALRAPTKAMSEQSQSAGDWMAQVRESERY